MKNKYYLCSIIAVTMLSMPQTSYAQSPGENYIVTETMLNETGTRSVKSVQYYDGLGRPSVLAAGGANTSGKYLYTMTEYDNMGRESKTWLPAVGTTSPSIITASTMSSKSDATYQSDGYAFSETTYDALGRPTFRSTPGKLWKGKGIKTDYITNAANSVRKYTLDSSGNPSGTMSYYPAASLTGEKVRDEDGNTIESYKDILGNVVLERRNGNNDTYYVYEAGLLRTVIPPLYQSKSDNSLLYKYEYDGLGRCTKKTLPGNIITTYCYDRSGRVIYMQDARLRSCGRHRFYMYDELGRLVVQGTVSSQTVPAGKDLFVRFSQTQSGICGTGYEYLAPSISNTDIIDRHILIDSEQNTPSQTGRTPISEIDDSNESYCNYVQEIDGALVELDNPQIEIVNYYDGYDFLNAGLFKTALNGADFSKSSPTCATTLQTGSIQSTSDGHYLCSVLYYDERGRVIDSRQTTINGAVMSQTTTYSFTNQPLQSVTKLKMGYMTPTVTETNVYDAKSDKLTSTSLNFGNAAIPVASITYDDLGRVKTRNSHGGNIRTSYTYDLHGWLTGLTATKANGSRLFQEDIHYADNSNPAINCYNGNISMVRWLSGDNPMGANICSGYTYTYDGLNRLTKATFGTGNIGQSGLSTNNDMGTVQYTYNANSSPTSLTRYGKKDVGYGIIDRLTYQYNGNQLKTITDTGSALHYDGAFEFSDANKAKLTQKVYDYDACGSMTYDPNRGITKIDYDLLGNPVRVQFCNGNVTEYVYSATGARLQTTYTTGISGVSSASTTIAKKQSITAKETLSKDVTYYMGNFIYTKDGLRYNFADGYTDGTTNGYHYYIRDHQGNNRVVAKYD
ncbi:MAG: hypothetical protein KBS99_07410, partial [Prevotellaceae bacterium]|nr:hypothetical protein [Candidatus Colivivens caballi]